MSLQPGPVPPQRQPVFLAPPASLWTCGLLVLSHLLYRVTGPRWQETALETFAFVPSWFLAQFEGGPAAPSPGGLLPLVSHAFLHGDALHLLLNAGLLLAFGSVVERRLGWPGFLVLFACATAAGALAETWLGGPRTVYLIGASAAVYGMIGAAVPVLFRGGGSRRHRRALEFVAVIMGLNVLVSVLGIADLLAGAEVAWRAHVGGFAAGLALALPLDLALRRRRR